MAHFQGDMNVLRMYDKRKKEIDIAREEMQDKEAALNASMSSSKAIKVITKMNDVSSCKMLFTQ